MKYFIYLIFTTLFFTNLHSDEITILAKKLNLYAGTKASLQWERIFSSQRRMKQYKLNTLSPELKNKLRMYLIEHAADSEQPIVPGL